SWDYDGPEASFEVEANGSNDSVSDNNYTINNPETDKEYKITVTAVSNDKKGPPATVSIRVEEPESDSEEDSENNQEEESNKNNEKKNKNKKEQKNNNKNEKKENTNDEESDGK